ncbi:helix-turn-helix domain-containing protein [Streptomyces sp. S07_1.15]|uniref:helix-turn-helix domain-containing protein n=1 Tax=Streptomyces sp. S07_1.15 TaxID=2873925 RepID=UPI001D136906|nr:helix-turn-helix domain-containing protein [Streptomyces sp. S07_1.15]MCC3654745.1 helix-turn-helix domain-containing protein [Streptomyces sp. S07_1.15]
MGTDNHGPEWLTRQQFADALQVHPKTVSRWIAADSTMRVRRLGPTGHRVRIHRSELERRHPGMSPIGDTTASV